MQTTPQIWSLPAQTPQASQALREQGGVVASLRFASSISREQARLSLRQSLKEMLAAAYEVSVSQIDVDNRRGCAPEIRWSSDDPFLKLTCSFAYEAEFAVFALAHDRPVGIDIVKCTTNFDWRDTARIYLGAVETSRLESCPSEQQTSEFFRAWSGLEAALKCLGLPLQEWTSDLALQLEQCQIAHVALDQNHMCAMATPIYAK